MRHFDLSPFHRSTIGFDRLFNLLDKVNNGEVPQSSYPPYNIEKTGESTYRISLAVAGFSENELSIESRENALFVRGEKAEPVETGNIVFQGIAARNFERHFQLADYVHVSSASLKDGLLHIDLLHEVPEAKKPRMIAINQSVSASRLAQDTPHAAPVANDAAVELAA